MEPGEAPMSETPAAASGVRPSAGAVRRRVWGAGIFVVAGTVLAISVWLKPSVNGYGTHRQLSATPCGVLVRTGLPCPTCGMTTSFALAVRGRWIRAFVVQPAGFVLALATGVAGLLGLRAALTGRDAEFLFRRVSPYRLFLSLLILLLAGWGFKLGYGILTGELPMPPEAVWRTG